MEHIVYLIDPTNISTTETHFKFKMPQLPSDRPDNMFIELLQLQLDMVASLEVKLDGLDLRLMTQASNYVSTDNNGICLGLFSYLRSNAGNNIDFAYTANANPYKLLISSHQDWLEFKLYDINNQVATGVLARCRMVLKITYPETPKQIGMDYARQIPLPSRLI